MNIVIAMATYNGGEYLLEQLTSIAQQTLTPNELIISDDNSTDNTLEIVQEFAKNAPFNVTVLKNQYNLGYTKNFNQALLAVEADFVFLCDQDDVWFQDKIEKMIKYFEADPTVQLMIHDLAYCKQDLSPIGQTKIERMEGVFDLHQEYVVGMATALRGPFARMCLPIPDKPGLAYDTWLHMCANALHTKKILRDVMALYRRHNSNATATGNLNVDFVTTPEHFKTTESRTIDLIKTKTTYENIEMPPPITWLQERRDELLSHHYISTEYLNEMINKGVTKNSNERLRAHLLQQPLIKRIPLILRFYFFGGYKQFSGWKSALKDILLN